MLAWITANPDSARRLLVKLLGVAVVLLGPVLMAKFGVSITDAQLESVAAMVVAYLVQSGVKSAAVAHGEAVAATPAPSVDAAKASLEEAVKAGTP